MNRQPSLSARFDRYNRFTMNPTLTAGRPATGAVAGRPATGDALRVPSCNDRDSQ
jgi:hypothetical protein